jgi:hypothetical protein
MDKTPMVIIIVIILAGAFFWALESGFLPANFTKNIGTDDVPSGIVLFYGEGCPHCKNVDDFVSKNKIEDKVKYTKMEVWQNTDNQKLLGEVAVKCGIDTNQIGVPLLYDGAGKCYSGDTDVINYLKNAAGIKE